VTGIIDILIGSNSISQLREMLIVHIPCLVKDIIPNLLTFSKTNEEDLMKEDPNDFINFNKDICKDKLTDTLRT